jgi:hypothetical protein
MPDTPSTQRESRFFKKRVCRVPTLAGWCVILLTFLLLSDWAIHRVHPFLARNHPVPATVLVVEGWASDETMQKVIALFHQGGYRQIFVTGGPLEYGAPLSHYGNYADIGALILVRLGLDGSLVQPVPAPEVMQDRTFASAIILKHWFEAHGGVPSAFNLVSVGPHARRSQLLFQKAFGKKSTVGIIAFNARDYDPSHWWRSSAGVRQVLDELLAYSYARFFFWPKKGS